MPPPDADVTIDSVRDRQRSLMTASADGSIQGSGRPDTLNAMFELPEELARSTARHQNKMARYLFEIARMEGLEDLGLRGALPLRVLRRYVTVMHLYDELTKILIGQLRRQGITIRCKRACTWCCCHMPAGLSVIELVYLYHGMHRSKIVSRSFRRCLESLEEWTKVSSQCKKEMSERSEKPAWRELALHRYQHLLRPCPFLHKGLCQIYEYRPIACRMHFSISPPYRCDPSHVENPNAIRIALEPGERVQDMLERIDKRFLLPLSDIMACGLLQLTVNVMRFKSVQWIDRTRALSHQTQP